MNHASKCVVFADWFGENSFRINSRCVTYSAFNFSSFQYTETNLCASYYYYYYKLQLSCHSVAVVLSLVHTKQIINIRKRNNTKNTVQAIQNTVNTSTRIIKNTHTYTHPHITKQVKTATVQDAHKWNSHNVINYPQYKVTLSTWHFYPQELHRNCTSLHLKIKLLHINHVNSLHIITLYITSLNYELNFVTVDADVTEVPQIVTDVTY